MDIGLVIENNPEIVFVLGAILLACLILGLFRFAQFLNEFSRELKQLNTEIGRTTGKEQQHWIRQKRRLLLSLIPFYKYK